MRVLIDADGCPVVRLAAALCREHGVPCTILCDTSHRFEVAGAEVIVCDKGTDSVDYRLVNLIAPGDLCITQDYGLAAMCLARQGRALSQDGLIYDSDNIGGLLEVRAFSGKVRRGGGRLHGQPKRTAAQDRAFERALRALLEERDAERDR